MTSASVTPSLRARLSAWTGIGSSFQLLYVTADQLLALRRSQRRWEVLARFRLGTDGEAVEGLHPGGIAAVSPVPEAFRQWIDRWMGDSFCFVLDSVDEEIETDELPNVRGRDREKVVERRLKQRFRDGALTTWIAPHRVAARKAAATNAKSRECTILVGLRQRNPMMLWIESALAAGARVARVESLALRSPALLRKVGGGATALLASVQPGGLRQTLVHNGEVSFTRLLPLDTPAPWANVCEELDRTVRFLMMSRASLRPMIQGGAFSVIVIADGIDRSAESDASMASLRLREATVPVSWIGDASSAQSDSLAGPLGGLPQFLRSGLRARANYAAKGMLANWRNSRLLAAGWSIAMISLVAATAANAFLRFTLSDRLDAADAGPRMAAVAALQNQAQDLERQLAAKKASAEEMSAVVDLAAQLRSRHVDAPATLVWVGRSLAGDSGLSLDDVSWEPVRILTASTAGVGVPVPGAVAPPAATSAAVPGAPGTPAPPVAVAAPVAGAATSPTLVRIIGHADLELGKELANDKVAALLERLEAACGCTGRVLVPPYDPSMDVAYARSLHDSNRVLPPRFTIEMQVPVDPADAAPGGGARPAVAQAAGDGHG